MGVKVPEVKWVGREMGTGSDTKPIGDAAIGYVEVAVPIFSQALGAVFAVMIGATSFADEPTMRQGMFKGEFLFQPAPFAQCHASTIVESRRGVVAAWFGGTREGHRDVVIWVSLRVGGQWTPPVEVANGVQSSEQRNPCLNPVFFQPTEGPLLLFFKDGYNPQV